MLKFLGQALGYKLGERRILSIKGRISLEMGKKFDIRAFHDAILAQGALPLDALEDYVYQEFCTQFNATCAN